jgi:hypothetical protein
METSALDQAIRRQKLLGRRPTEPEHFDRYIVVFRTEAGVTDFEPAATVKGAQEMAAATQGRICWAGTFRPLTQAELDDSARYEAVDLNS